MALTLGEAKRLPATKAAQTEERMKAGWKRLLAFFKKPVTSGELIFFNSQLSLMMEIGMPLTGALQTMADQTKNPAFRQIISAMVRDLEGGRQLSEAMGAYPDVFDPVYTSLIKAGETGGFLKKTLDAVVAMQEKKQVFISQMRSTMTYPVVLCVTSLAVVVFVLIGILPKFTVLYEGKEALLPFNTRFLIAASASLKGYWWAYVSGTIAFISSITYCLKSKAGRSLADRLLITAPLLAGLTNKIYVGRLLRTLGHLMESSVTLVDALAVTQPTFRNRYYREFVSELKGHVEQGERFSRHFSTSPHILDSVKQMVSTGEEVGELTKVMLRLSEFYDVEVDRELKLVSALISPIALMFLGSVVALIVSSIVLPMFRIAGAIQ